MLHIIVDRKSLLKAITIVENAVTENKIREVLSEFILKQMKERQFYGEQTWNCL